MLPSRGRVPAFTNVPPAQVFDAARISVPPPFVVTIVRAPFQSPMLPVIAFHPLLMVTMFGPAIRNIALPATLPAVAQLAPPRSPAAFPPPPPPNFPPEPPFPPG